MTERKHWRTLADLIDQFRLIPRVLIVTYYLFFLWAWTYIVDWFMAYEWAAVTNQAVALALAGFPATILGVLTVVLGKLTDNYFRTGRLRKGG